MKKNKKLCKHNKSNCALCLHNQKQNAPYFAKNGYFGGKK